MKNVHVSPIHTIYIGCQSVKYIDWCIIWDAQTVKQQGSHAHVSYVQLKVVYNIWY